MEGKGIKNMNLELYSLKVTEILFVSAKGKGEVVS